MKERIGVSLLLAIGVGGFWAFATRSPFVLGAIPAIFLATVSGRVRESRLLIAIVTALIFAVGNLYLLRVMGR